jgi:S1-C subfamily serine protease
MTMRKVRTFAVVLAVAAAAAAATALLTGFRGSAAATLQEDYIEVVRTVAPSVVQIERTGGAGSGVILDDRGNIVTNAHVIGSARTLTVTLANGQQRQATRVGAYEAGDIAVVRVANTEGLRPAKLADSKSIQVGQIVMAIGNPLGFQSSVTEGIVSGLGRATGSLTNVVQTSAPINPGNSGGALVDLEGRVVGIPTLGSRGTGIGFAIPADTVRDLTGQLIRNGRVTSSGRAFLGVRIGSTIGADGVLVGDVTAGGAAARAGIQEGDVILSLGGDRTPSLQTLAEALAKHKPGDRVQVELRRGGDRRTVTVTLGEFQG